MLGTGIRVSEYVGLNIEDVDLNEFRFISDDSRRKAIRNFKLRDNPDDNDNLTE